MTRALVVRPVPGVPDHYTVTSGTPPQDRTYTVDASVTPLVCQCEAYRYFPKQRPCKHGRKVLEYRAEPQAKVLDALDDQRTLDLIDQSVDGWRTPFTVKPVDPKDRAIALGVIQRWHRLRNAGQPAPRWLYKAMCRAYAGLDAERQRLPSAAESFADVRKQVERRARRGVA